MSMKSRGCLENHIGFFFCLAVVSMKSHRCLENHILFIVIYRLLYL